MSCTIFWAIRAAPKRNPWLATVCFVNPDDPREAVLQREMDSFAFGFDVAGPQDDYPKNGS
jgi:hypothetical protein